MNKKKFVNLFKKYEIELKYEYEYPQNGNRKKNNRNFTLVRIIIIIYSIVHKRIQRRIGNNNVLGEQVLLKFKIY